MPRTVDLCMPMACMFVMFCPIVCVMPASSDRRTNNVVANIDASVSQKFHQPPRAAWPEAILRDSPRKTSSRNKPATTCRTMNFVNWKPKTFGSQRWIPPGRWK